MSTLDVRYSGGEYRLQSEQMHGRLPNACRAPASAAGRSRVGRLSTDCIRKLALTDKGIRKRGLRPRLREYQILYKTKIVTGKYHNQRRSGKLEGGREWHANEILRAME